MVNLIGWILSCECDSGVVICIICCDNGSFMKVFDHCSDVIIFVDRLFQRLLKRICTLCHYTHRFGTEIILNVGENYL